MFALLRKYVKLSDSLYLEYHSNETKNYILKVTKKKILICTLFFNAKLITYSILGLEVRL